MTLLFTGLVLALDPPADEVCTTNLCAAEADCRYYQQTYTPPVFDIIVDNHKNQLIRDYCKWPDIWDISATSTP